MTEREITAVAGSSRRARVAAGARRALTGVAAAAAVAFGAFAGVGAATPAGAAGPAAAPAGTVAHAAVLTDSQCGFFSFFSSGNCCSEVPFWWWSGEGNCREGYSPRPLHPRITGSTSIGHHDESFTIAISGTGFEPNETVTLSLRGRTGVLATTSADATGAFTVDVTFPSGLSVGLHTLVATGGTSHARATFTVVVLPGPFSWWQFLSGFFFGGSSHGHLTGFTYPSGHSRDVRVSQTGTATLVSRVSGTTAAPSSTTTVAVAAGAGALAAAGLAVLLVRRRRAGAAQS